MIIKPVKGKKVYDPAKGDYLPDEGRNVEFNQYWARRLAGKEVEEVTVKTNKKADKNDNQL